MLWFHTHTWHMHTRTHTHTIGFIHTHMYTCITYVCTLTCYILMRALSYPPRFLSPTNQRVTDSLIDTVYNDSNGAYSVKDIKRAAHRYYESRRRLGIEDLPDRQEKAAEQRKKRKYRARQQRAYDRYY